MREAAIAKSKHDPKVSEVAADAEEAYEGNEDYAEGEEEELELDTFEEAMEVGDYW